MVNNYLDLCGAKLRYATFSETSSKEEIVPGSVENYLSLIQSVSAEIENELNECQDVLNYHVPVSIPVLNLAQSILVLFFQSIRSADCLHNLTS